MLLPGVLARCAPPRKNLVNSMPQNATSMPFHLEPAVLSVITPTNWYKQRLL